MRFRISTVADDSWKQALKAFRNGDSFAVTEGDVAFGIPSWTLRAS